MSDTVKVSGSKLIQASFKNKDQFPKGLETPAQEIVDHLKTTGVEVSVQLVNNVKFRIRKMKEDKKASKEPTKRIKVAVPVVATISPVQSEFDRMVAVKKLSTEFGGLDALSDLIAKLKTLAS
jgi:hypothetical protein